MNLNQSYSLQLIEELYQQWKELDKSGNLKGEYRPDWWLNKTTDPFYLFLKWVAFKTRKSEDK